MTRAQKGSEARDAATQQTREWLALGQHHLLSLQVWLSARPPDLARDPASDFGPLFDRALQRLIGEHARIDLDLLRAGCETWSHPAQVLRRPRAPFGAVAELCKHQLRAAAGSPDLRLRRIGERLSLAADLEARASLRRLTNQLPTLAKAGRTAEKRNP